MLRIAYHTLYKIYYIMYYITWHKIFHRFVNKDLSRMGMVLIHKAVKYCCPLCLAIALLVFTVSCDTLNVSAASGKIEIFASSGVWVSLPASISPTKHWIEADLTFSNIPLADRYAWFLKVSRGRVPINGSMSFGAYIEKGTPFSSIRNVMILYNGKFYHDSGVNPLSSGFTGGIVYPASTPGQSFQFDVPNPPADATPITLSYPSNGYDNFGADSFKSISFFENGTTNPFHYYRFYRFFVDDDGYTLPMDATNLKIYFKFVINMRAYVLADSSDILDSVDSGFSNISDNFQSIEQSVDSGFSQIHKDITNQTDVITNNNDKNTQIIHKDIINQTDAITNNNDKNTQKIHKDIINQTDAITNNNDKNTQKILDQNSQFRQEDRQEAQSVGQIAKEFLDTNTEKVKSNFNILWEPIAFTQRVISVFSGGTRSVTYADRYDGVVGFTYNEDTGCLDPVIDISPRARYGRASSGTTITFPAYTLPVLNIKLWDAYTFDVSTIKDAFPALFDAIYIFSGILCLYWFLGFLSQKFEEVFKE